MNNILSIGAFFTVFWLTVFGLLIPQTVFCQTEKLGIVQYMPPKGWAKTPKENVVAFSEINQTTGKFCIITLYGATPGTGNPNSDFTREWNNLVVKNMKADANPKTDTQAAEGWTVISGGSEADSEAGKAIAFLTVISGFETTISVLAVFNDPAYVKEVDAFISAIEMDKPAEPAKTSVASAPPAVDSYGNLIIPLLTRQLTVADLAGEWGEGDTRMATAYYSANTGNYVGTDRVAFKTKSTITKNGGYSNDFFEIRNGKKLSDKTTGTISIDGRVISIISMNNDTKRNSTSSYVVIGWLDLPDMTLMSLSSNFWGGEIPEQFFTNLSPQNSHSSIWIRKKK